MERNFGFMLDVNSWHGLTWRALLELPEPFITGKTLGMYGLGVHVSHVLASRHAQARCRFRASVRRGLSCHNAGR